MQAVGPNPGTWREHFATLLAIAPQLYTPELAGAPFDEDFRHGLIQGLLVKRDPRLMEGILPQIVERLVSQDFKDQVVALHCIRMQEAIKLADPADAIGVETIRVNTAKITNACWEQFEAECRSLQPTYGTAVGADDRLGVALCVAQLLWHHLNRQDPGRFVEPRHSLLAAEYACAGVDLFDSDEQFNAYGLLTVTDQLQFPDAKPREPFDPRVGKHLTLDADGWTIQQLAALRRAGLIGSLAFRPRFNVGLRGRTSPNISLEAVERGPLFELSGLGEPRLSKLYSDDYDTLWVKSKPGDLTFEELMQEFVIEGDYIVTQVVHLQHVAVEGVELIHHIDHEFIYYTEAEYEARQLDPDQKGEARSRIKTFKADQSRIPFIRADGSCFLFELLARHFTSTDLLREYFGKVI